MAWIASRFDNLFGTAGHQRARSGLLHILLMASLKTKTTATDALVVLSTVALTTFIVATLYFARELLIPLALSALLTFLLSPLVTRIERWIGRIAAVLLVVALIFTGFGAAGWMLTQQLIDLATK